MKWLELKGGAYAAIDNGGVWCLRRNPASGVWALTFSAGKRGAVSTQLVCWFAGRAEGLRSVMGAAQ